MADNGGTPLAVRSRAWCRVDLAGGTLDIWPIGLLHRDATTLNVAIDLAVELDIRTTAERFRVMQQGSMVEASSIAELLQHPETRLLALVLDQYSPGPVEVSIRSASPRGGGLGASSALTIAAIAGMEFLRGQESSTSERAAMARDLEARLMSLPTGVQDHFPALLGGVLEIRHRAGGPDVRRLDVDMEGLAQSLVVVFTGQSHFSAGNNWQIIRRRLEGEAEVVHCFEEIAGIANASATALASGDLERVGVLMSEEWSWRRRLAKGISTPTIESLIEAGLHGGAWGAKVCGAGGGGCLTMLCPPEAREDIAVALRALGGQVLPARPTAKALEVRPA